MSAYEFPLTSAQRWVWLDEALRRDRAAYVSEGLWEGRGQVDAGAVAAALQLVADRHDALRTSVVVRAEGPVQRLEPSAAVPVERRTCGRSDAEWDAAFGALLTDVRGRPIELERVPLARFHLLAGGERFALLARFHHVVWDGRSTSIFARDLSLAYESVVSGRPPAWSALPVRSVDYAMWEQRHRARVIASERFAAAATLLRERFDGTAPAVPDGAPRAAAGPDGLPLDPAAVDLAATFARTAGVTTFAVYLAALASVLAEGRDRASLTIGVPFGGRGRVELQDVMGHFVNPVPLLLDVDAGADFLALVTGAHEALARAHRWEDLPFDALVSAARPRRGPGHQPLFPAMAIWHGVEDRAQLRLGAWTSDCRHLAVEAARVPLAFVVDSRPERTLLRAEGSLSPARAAALAERVAERLRAGGARPATRVRELPAPPPDPAAADPWALIAAAARAAPDRVAVQAADERLTYRALVARAGALAAWLAGRGVGPERVVAVRGRPGPALLTWILAVIAAGGAYLPIDPATPVRRVRDLLEAAGAALAIVDDPAGLEGAGIPLVDVAAAPGLPETPAGVPLRHPDLLAYVIFTSGSTGRPKPVGATRGGLANLMEAQAPAFGLTPADSVLQFSSLAFDASVSEVFVTLGAGATLALLRGERTDPAAIEGAAATVATLPPSVLAALPPGSLPSVRTLVSAGEPLTRRLADRWASGRTLINAYGPTETTVCATAGPVVVGEAAPGLGPALANTSVRVLDQTLREVGPGGVGELHVGGPAVARGYLGLPALTAERFVPDPWGRGGRLYRTGDRVRLTAGGELEFVGRADEQVKVRGHRVDPAEVEAALGGHAGVRQCAVVARPGPGDHLQLTAYYVAGAGARPEPAALRAHLAARLPAHLVPGALVEVADLPLTISGKVDRGRLRDEPPPAISAPAASPVPPAAPDGEIERALAALWEQVLGVEGVGAGDNFFALGGDSILSMGLAARAAAAGLSLPPHLVFEARTLRELAARVLPRAADATPVPVAGRVPLSPAQAWFLDAGFAVPRRWSHVARLRAAEGVTPGVLRAALAVLERRHDGLRLRFSRGVEDQWRAERLAPGREVPFLVAASGEGVDALVERLLAEVDPFAGSVWAAGWIGGGAAAELVLVVHHLAVDLVSWSVLVEELNLLCAGGGEAALGQAGTPFGAWTEALDRWAQGPEVLAELPWWIEQLPETGEPAPAGPRAESSRELSEPETARILAAARRHGAQLSDLAVAAVALAVAPAGRGRTAVTLMLEAHGRSPLGAGLDVQRTVGWFTALHPVRLDVDRSLPAPQVLTEVRRRLGMTPGRGVGYGLLRHLAPEPARGRLRSRPEPAVVLNVTADLAREGSWPGALLALESLRLDAGDNRAPFATEVEVGLHNGRLRVTVAAPAGLTADRVVAALEACAEDGARPGAFPLSPMQRGLYLHSLLTPGSGDYVEHLVWEMATPAAARALRDAWERAVPRQPVLRTAFAWDWVAESGHQFVREDVRLEVDHRRCPGHEGREGAPACVSAFVEEDAARGFVLDRAPLARLTVLECGARTYVALAFHHLLLDGWSGHLLLRDVLADAHARPAYPYERYVRWLAEQDQERARRAWAEHLDGYRPPAGGHGATAGRRTGGVEVVRRPFAVPPDAGRAGPGAITLATMATAAWAVVYGRAVGAGDVVVGSAVSVRPPEAGAESLIGFCVSTIPIRVPASRLWRGGAFDPDALAAFQQECARMRRFAYLGLPEILEAVRWRGSRTLLESVVGFENFPGDPLTGETDAADTGIVQAWHFARTNFPLALLVEPVTRELWLHHHTARWTAAEAAELLEETASLLALMADLRPVSGPL